MTYTIAGVVGFLLFVLYDINSVLWRRKSLHCGFFAGNVLIIGATIMLIKRVWNEAFVSMVLSCGACWSLFLLGLLIYTLFLPCHLGIRIRPWAADPRSAARGCMPCAGIRGFCGFSFFICFWVCLFTPCSLWEQEWCSACATWAT